MACILAEIYTGELFFETDDNFEHLAKIEKQCGPIPLHMAKRCGNEIKYQLHRRGTPDEESYVRSKGMRLRWPAAARSATSRDDVKDMLMLDTIIRDEWGEDHRMFKDLLKMMLKVDPRDRPSASQCLSHFFLNIIESHKQLCVADCDILWNRSGLLNRLWKHDLVRLFRRLFLDVEGLVFIRFLFIFCIYLLSRWLINLHLADLKLHRRYFVH